MNWFPFSVLVTNSAHDRVSQVSDFILGIKNEDCRYFFYDNLRIFLFNNILFYLTFNTRPLL